MIVRKTVSRNIEKVREAVKGINYSDTPGIDVTEAGTIRPTATK